VSPSAPHVVSPASSELLVSPASSLPLPEDDPEPASSVLPPLLELLELLLEPPPLDELLLDEEPPPEDEEEDDEEEELDELLPPLAPPSCDPPPVGATHCPAVHTPLQQSVAVEQLDPLDVHVAPTHAPDLQL
jgi:hypothetical protein